MKNGKKKKSIRYYDSFATEFEAPVHAGEDFYLKYNYQNNGFFYKALAFVMRYVIAPLPAFFCSRILMRERVVGKKKLKLKGGFIMYGNHTEPVMDAVTPHTLVFPRRAKTVVSPDNFALPVLGGIIGFLGALPTPCDIKTAREFNGAIGAALKQGQAVVVFPEAHVWQGYTGIRPMDKSAFSFPDKFSVPAFTATRVYKKSRIFKFKRIIYIDGPYYADKSLPLPKAQLKLEKEVAAVMRLRAELSDFKMFDYVERK